MLINSMIFDRGHEFGAVPLHRIYYDRKLEAHSEDAADPEKTCRVMTIMLAEEH